MNDNNIQEGRRLWRGCTGEVETYEYQNQNQSGGPAEFGAQDRPFLAKMRANSSSGSFGCLKCLAAAPGVPGPFPRSNFEGLGDFYHLHLLV